MIRVEIIGQSNLRNVAAERGILRFEIFEIELFCCPEATTTSITSYPEYSRQKNCNFDVLFVLLGGNDITKPCNISEIYSNLKTLIEDFNNIIWHLFNRTGSKAWRPKICFRGRLL